MIKMLSREDRNLWDGMLRKSFHPSQWFYDDDLGSRMEERIMWVYKPDPVTVGRFDVGYWSPARQWVEDSVGHSRESAAKRVHFLNGGK